MYVGIDIGTGSLKAVLGLKTGLHTISHKYKEEMFISGSHRIDLFTDSVREFLIKISNYSKDKNELIEGIGFCGHGPSIVLVSETGECLTDIITWQDNSASESAEKLKYLIKGFSKDGSSYEAKLYKLFTDKKDVFKKHLKVLYPKDYVIFLLTGRMVMDFPTASTLSFYKAESRLFDTGTSGIPTDIFPEIVESWEESGRADTVFSRECALPDGIPIITGGIDAWCEALGAGAIEDGMVVDGSGTSTCITCCRKNESSKLYHVIKDRSLDIETMSSTGASIAWVIDLLGINLNEIKKIDSFVPVPIIFLPYLDGERSPVWDEKASASFTGLSSKNDSVDVIRSVLQGIAFGTRQCIEIAGRGSEYRKTGIRAVGGGANNRALLQYKSNISGIKYFSMEETDAAALGSMMLASFGCGEGTISSLTEKWVKISYEITPDFTHQDIWEKLFKIYSDHIKRIKETNDGLFYIKNKLDKHDYVLQK